MAVAETQAADGAGRGGLKTREDNSVAVVGDQSKGNTPGVEQQDGLTGAWMGQRVEAKI